MICVNGHQVTDGNRFCGQCGGEISAQNSNSPFPPPNSPTQAESVSFSTMSTTKSQKPLLIASVVAALVLLIGGLVVFGSSSNSGKVTIRGIALLMSKDTGDVTGSWDDCKGTGGYDDFSAGRNITIKNEKSEIIGAGAARNLSEDIFSTLVEMNKDISWYGEIKADSSPEDTIKNTFVVGANAGMACGLYFEIKTDKSEFYEIEMGSRGKLSYSQSEMEKNGFAVSLTLGDD